MSNKLKELILIGGGGHCHACIDVIELENKYKIIGILDTQEKVGSLVLGYPVIGTDKDIASLAKTNRYFLITVGKVNHSDLRKNLFNKVQDSSGIFATIISPRAYISQTAVIQEGCIIMHDALINTNSIIESNCIINNKALVEHDCIVGAHSHISTSTVINGSVSIGEDCFIASHAVVIQNSIIPDNSFIKANSIFPSKKIKPIAFLTTLYPTEEVYIDAFLSSLTSQTYQHFHLIVVNDGYEDFDFFKKRYNNLTIIELSSTGNIAKNREIMLKYAKQNNYQFAVLGDIDDTFSNNRIELSIKALQENDIVVNDLNIMNMQNITVDKLYSKRLDDQQLICSTFITDKNVFGLSNTAINLKKVPLSCIEFPKELIAVDWYFFSLLLCKGLKARFINQATTYYRQHGSNTIGHATFDKQRIQKIFSVRLIHYKYMKNIYNEFESLYLKTVKTIEQLEDETYLIELLSKNTLLVSPLWWEVLEE